MSINNYPGPKDGHDAPYFPPLYGRPDCTKCDLRKACPSCEKFQRDRRDFTVTSGRCPRLPDKRGFVEEGERTRYASIFPLIHAERSGSNRLRLTLYLPNHGPGRKVNYHKTLKRWWVRMTENGEPLRRCLRIENGMQNAQCILDYMASRGTDFCIFRCGLDDAWL